MKAPRVIAKIGRMIRNEQIVLAVLAVAVGCAVAYAAIGFRLGLDYLQIGFLGFQGENVHSEAARQPWWRILLAPALGGLAVGLMLHFWTPEGRLKGVAQVIEAMAHKGGFMRLREGVAAALINITALASGSSTGREGPMVHLGASVASTIAQRLNLGPDLARTILGCGAAAAVSASFNAPIAGVFFALEVIIGNYAMATFAPVVIASVAGTVISRIHLGALPAFIVPEYLITSFWEFPAFLLLGIICALIAVCMMRSIFFAEDVVTALRIPVWLRPVLGGLAVGALAVNFPQILGVGYEGTDAALNELFPLWLLIALILLKTAATAISVGCRFGGGVFSPSLFIGAMVGGAYGLIAAFVFPELATNHGAYAMVGMSAFAAAVLGAPISTILIVFELTGDYAMTIATMIATAPASLVALQLQGGSFFDGQLRRLGVPIGTKFVNGNKNWLTVGDVMSKDFATLPFSASRDEILELCRRRPDWTIFVTDGDKLVGSFYFATLRDLVLGQLDAERGGCAGDLVSDELTPVVKAHSLEMAMQMLDRTHAEFLPVVEDLKNRKLVGLVHYKALLHAGDDPV